MSLLKKSELVAIAATHLGIRVLALEYAIVLDLFENGSASPGDIKRRLRAPSTTFYLKLRDLAGAGHIIAERAHPDRRFNHYRLADSVRSMLLAGFASMTGWISDRVSRREADGAVLERFIANTSGKLRIRFFTPEFQTILMLYDRDNALAGELFSASGASSTKFYTALNRLAAKRLVQVDQEAEDLRRKRYSLPDGVRSHLDFIHDGLRAWILDQIAAEQSAAAQ